MRKLFQKVTAWLRSRVTAVNTLRVYENTNENLLKVKGENNKGKVGKATFNLKKGALTLPEVQAVLRSKYELRYNLLSEQSEYRERGSAGDFIPITKRVYMTWLMDLQAEGYHYTWLEGVRIAAESLHIPSYHPVTQYFATLPQWDGTDRLRPLMQRLTTDDTMVGYLCRCDARLMKCVCAQTFGKVLRGLGAVRSEHHDKRVYAVVPVE